MGACDLLWNSSTVQARYENCGRVPRETAEALGLVGMAGGVLVRRAVKRELARPRA